jgi:ABC-type sugar transport system substrate-binding protein
MNLLSTSGRGRRVALRHACRSAGFREELKNIGMSVGSMSNPYFIALAEGATNAAKKINEPPS